MTDVAVNAHGQADEQTDLDLIARWMAGDQQAATLLVERHAAALARFASSVGARGDVEEVVQDTFVRAFGSIDSFRAERAWRGRSRMRSRSTIRWTKSWPVRRDSGLRERWLDCRQRSVRSSRYE